MAKRTFNSGDEWRAYLAARFGANWAICRKTAANRAKYSCITQAQYLDAEIEFQASVA
jgi:hypothetical protein